MLPPRLRIILLALAVGALSGCVEVMMEMRLARDGSGTVDIVYAVYRNILDGDAIEIEKNDLLPLSREEAETWARRLPGVQLLSFSVEEREIDRAIGGRAVGGLRVFKLVASFDGVESLRFDHIRFARYPWGDGQWFRMDIDKDVPPFGDDGPVNEFADVILQGRMFRLTTHFPSRVIEANADAQTWSSATWTVPMRSIFSTPEQAIRLWAKTALLEGEAWKGRWYPWWYRWSGEGWRDPDALPRKALPPAAPTPFEPYPMTPLGPPGNEGGAP